MKILYITYYLNLGCSLSINQEIYKTFCIKKDMQKGETIRIYFETPNESKVYTFLKIIDKIIYSSNKNKF
jgi:hypothetical protein